MPISKLIWNMSLPIIASMLVQALYNIVDSVFVSRVSEQALTAVSLAFPAQNLMIGLATGTAVGVNALMGRALGAGQRERADKVANHGILLALVGFVISALLGATCSDLFFRSQTQIENIIRMGNDYLRVVTIGSLGMFCQIMYERLLQGTGRSILSMYTQGLGAIINIILDPIFIFGFRWGMMGAAVATVIGQLVTAALAVWYLLHMKIIRPEKNPSKHNQYKSYQTIKNRMQSFGYIYLREQSVFFNSDNLVQPMQTPPQNKCKIRAMPNSTHQEGYKQIPQMSVMPHSIPSQRNI